MIFFGLECLVSFLAWSAPGDAVANGELGLMGRVFERLTPVSGSCHEIVAWIALHTELLKMGVTRARGVKSDIVLSICGEHGGSPESIDFCRKIGMDYVSCSPFRVPVAKLAAAQLAIKDRIDPSK